VPGDAVSGKRRLHPAGIHSAGERADVIAKWTYPHSPFLLLPCLFYILALLLAVVAGMEVVLDA